MTETEQAPRLCSYCQQPVIVGKSGWRTPESTVLSYRCPDAPHGRHRGDKPNVEEEL